MVNGMLSMCRVENTYLMLKRDHDKEYSKESMLTCKKYCTLS